MHSTSTLLNHQHNYASWVCRMQPLMEDFSGPGSASLPHFKYCCHQLLAFLLTGGSTGLYVLLKYVGKQGLISVICQSDGSAYAALTDQDYCSGLISSKTWRSVDFTPSGDGSSDKLRLTFLCSLNHRSAVSVTEHRYRR